MDLRFGAEQERLRGYQLGVDDYMGKPFKGKELMARVDRIMERTGLSRYVWHLPLFFLALVVLLSSLIGMVFQP